MNTPTTSTPDPQLRYEIAQLEMIRQHIHADLAQMRMQEENLRRYESQLREREAALPVASDNADERALLAAEREKLARASALLEAERRSLAGERLLLREERAAHAQSAPGAAVVPSTWLTTPAVPLPSGKTATRAPMALAERAPVARRLSLPTNKPRHAPTAPVS